MFPPLLREQHLALSNIYDQESHARFFLPFLGAYASSLFVCFSRHRPVRILAGVTFFPCLLAAKVWPEWPVNYPLLSRTHQLMAQDPSLSFEKAKEKAKKEALKTLDDNSWTHMIS